MCNLLVKIKYFMSKCKNNWVFACILIINVYLCTQFKHKL
ncbi:KxYKxGKxW signal peptide domain-containing protein [Prevotella ruminicola]